jgi:hypothetical protein
MPSILNATTSSGLVTSADNSGSLQLATNNGTTAVTIDTSQNVGIGTASPSQKLDVAGSAIIGNTSGNQGLVIGNASGNSAAYVNYVSSSAVVNWQVGSNIINAGSLTFTPSTATGGSTFTTAAGRFDSSGNFYFNSGYGSAGVAYGCRAWVNFNGTGTVAIRASGNVSSITDNGTGDYTVNFSTAMPDANFSAVPQAGEISGSNNNSNTRVLAISTTTTRIGVKNADFSFADYDLISLAIFR